MNDFSNKLRTLVYNNFISLTSYLIQDISQYAELQTASLIIFSYPNCKDFKLDITNYLTQHHNITIDLNMQCTIDNNIFGFIRKEFKIIDFPEIFKIYSSKDEGKINKGESLNVNETLIVILSRNESVNIPTLGRIEYVMVVTEPDYNECDRYTYMTECECFEEEDDENNGYYIKKNYTGRYSYCDIKVDESQLTNHCGNNCNLCLRSNTKCVFEENEENSETLITTIPKAIPTTISKAIITTIPKAIITTIPEIIIPTTPEKIIPNTIIPETTYIEKANDDKEIINTIITNPDNNYIKPESTNLEEVFPKTYNIELNIINYTNIKNEETELNYIDKLNCTKDEIINGKCNNGTITSNQIDQIKNELLKSGNNSILIRTDKMAIHLASLEEQKKDIPGVSNIDLGDCESILKKNYNISENEVLVVFKVDFKAENSSSTYVEYEIYDPTKTIKLEIDLCKDVPITINVPVVLDESIDLLYDTFSESGYNIFNENDSFYQDVCSTYTTINGTDMLLSDRKKDIFTLCQNQTLCQVGCEFKSYNSNTKKAQCDCESKGIKQEEINDINFKDLFNKKEIGKNFYKTLTNSNFQVLKCYKFIFSSKIKQNVGEILMATSLLVFIALEVASLIISKKLVYNYIDILIKNNFNPKIESNKLERRKTGKSKSQKEKKRKSKRSKSASSKKKNYKHAPNKKRIKINNDKISSSALNAKEKMNDKNIIINNINIVNNNNDITLYSNNHRKLTNRSKSFNSKLNLNIKNEEL